MSNDLPAEPATTPRQAVIERVLAEARAAAVAALEAETEVREITRNLPRAMRELAKAAPAPAPEPLTAVAEIALPAVPGTAPVAPERQALRTRLLRLLNRLVDEEVSNGKAAACPTILSTSTRQPNSVRRLPIS